MESRVTSAKKIYERQKQASLSKAVLNMVLFTIRDIRSRTWGNFPILTTELESNYGELTHNENDNNT